MGELKRIFRPEFLNRIDDVIVFHALEKEHIQRIVDLMLAEVETRLKDFDLGLTVTPAAKEFLAEKGFDPMFGARPLRRAIQQLVEDEISEEMLKGTFGAGDRIKVGLEQGKLKFTKAEDRKE